MASDVGFDTDEELLVEGRVEGDQLGFHLPAHSLGTSSERFTGSYRTTIICHSLWRVGLCAQHEATNLRRLFRTKVSAGPKAMKKEEALAQKKKKKNEQFWGFKVPQSGGIWDLEVSSGSGMHAYSVFTWPGRAGQFLEPEG